MYTSCGVFNHINSNLYHYAGNNPVKYTDPTGRWFGFDDIITGPIDEIAVLGALTIIGAVSIYNSDANKNFAEALKESFTYNLNRIKSFFAKDEKNSEAKTVENQSPITDDGVNSGKEAENQSLPDMKKNPPAHPDYEPPKKWDGQKVKNPNGKGSGWPAKNGDVWVPEDHKGTHAPHWDVQHKDGTHTPIYQE